jgi:hypothetical protein
MIRVWNWIYVHALDFVVNDELLLLILRTFSPCTNYTLHEILDFFFQSVIVVECSVAPTSNIPLIPTVECSLPHRARHNRPLPPLRGSSRVLLCVLTSWRIVVPSFSGSSTPRTVAALLNQKMLRQANRGKLALCSSWCPLNSYKYHVCLRNA